MESNFDIINFIQSLKYGLVYFYLHSVGEHSIGEKFPHSYPEEIIQNLYLLVVLEKVFQYHLSQTLTLFHYLSEVRSVFLFAI